MNIKGVLACGEPITEILRYWGYKILDALGSEFELQLVEFHMMTNIVHSWFNIL